MMTEFYIFELNIPLILNQMCCWNEDLIHIKSNRKLLDLAVTPVWVWLQIYMTDNRPTQFHWYFTNVTIVFIFLVNGSCTITFELFSLLVRFEHYLCTMHHNVNFESNHVLWFKMIFILFLFILMSDVWFVWFIYVFSSFL